METKQSTVSKVLHNVRQYDSKFGKMYVHQIRFDNGDAGDYSSKTETCTKFKEGEQVDYTIEFREYNGNRFATVKPVQQQQFGGGKRGGNESFALAYAKDLGIARNDTDEAILKTADIFLNWLNSKK